MNYRPLLSADPNNKPRFLTDEEINYITDGVPYNPLGETLNSNLTREFIRYKYSMDLRREKLVPSMIDTCKTRISERHFKSIAEAGMAVGNSMAADVSVLAMQNTLSNFHSSGQGTFNSSSTIESLQTLIMARINVRNPICYIGFRRRLSMNQFMNYAPGLIGTTVSSIISSHSFGTPEEMEQEWWSNLSTIESFYGTIPFRCINVLRLELNIREMFKQNIQISQVAKVISSLSGVFTVYSPQNEGIIHCYRKPVYKMPELSKDIEEKYYYQGILIPYFNKLYVKGIHKITAIYPMRFRIWNVVAAERESDEADINEIKMYDYKSLIGKLYTLVLSLPHIISNNIEINDILSLLENYTKTTRLWSSSDNLVHIYSSDEVDNEGKVISPGVALNAKVKAETKNYANLLKSIDVDIIPEPPTILNDYYILRCAAEGSELAQLMIHPLVDPDTTYCNSIHVVNHVLGIEAARSIFMRELMRILTNISSNFLVSHVELLADLIFSKGYPYGATSIGVSRRGGGIITLASSDGYKGILTRGAILGSTEQAGSNTFSMISGQPANDSVGKFSLVHTITDKQGNQQHFIDDDCWKHYQGIVLQDQGPRGEVPKDESESDVIIVPIPTPSDLGAQELGVTTTDIAEAIARIAQGLGSGRTLKHQTKESIKTQLIEPDI